jgi:hypothetical protein
MLGVYPLSKYSLDFQTRRISYQLNTVLTFGQSDIKFINEIHLVLHIGKAINSAAKNGSLINGKVFCLYKWKSYIAHSKINIVSFKPYFNIEG